MTPTEALTAMEFGAEFVKVFPAVSLALHTSDSYKARFLKFLCGRRGNC